MLVFRGRWSKVVEGGCKIKIGSGYVLDLAEQVRRRKNRRRKKGRRSWDRRDRVIAEHDILRGLYHGGPASKYRTMCYGMSSHMVYKRIIAKLLKHGLIQRVKNIEQDGEIVEEGFAITERGTHYREKMSALLKMMGVNVPDYVGIE